MKRFSVVVKTAIVSIVSVGIAFLPIWGIALLIRAINGLKGSFPDTASIGYQLNAAIYLLLLGIAGAVQIGCIFALCYWLRYLWTDKFAADRKIALRLGKQ